jgi:hypothetical protein
MGFSLFPPFSLIVLSVFKVFLCVYKTAENGYILFRYFLRSATTPLFNSFRLKEQAGAENK